MICGTTPKALLQVFSAGINLHLDNVRVWSALLIELSDGWFSRLTGVLKLTIAS